MSFTNLKYHVIFSTKNHRLLLSTEIRPRLVKYIGGIVRNLKGILIEANGPEDHMHLAVGIHPSNAVSDFVRDVKANATSWVHETFPKASGFSWQDEYSAFTISQSQLPAVVEYIRKQAEHHEKMSFDEELKILLQKHEVKFDERYLS